MRVDLAVLIESIWAFLLRTAGLSAKSPFGVIVRAEPLWWTGADGQPEEIGGLYTHRLVMASSADDAAVRVLELVRREMEDFARNPPDAPVRIEMQEIRRLKGIIRWHGRGFTFWPKEHNGPVRGDEAG